MGKAFIGMCCLLVCGISAVESEIQFENDQVRASKRKIMAHEEIGLHRDDYPQVVISLKGGTITRLEGDGSTVEIDFPKGEAVFMEADPLGQLHRSANKTCKPIEMIIIELKGRQALAK
jgi:hypothetical protein